MLDVAVTFLGGQFAGCTPGMGSEWPPHPARLLYALIGAWYDGGEREDEGAALRWLEEQPAPVIAAPPSAPEEGYEAWVPMNSLPNWNKKGSKRPTLPKAIVPRTSRFVGDDPISFLWPLDVPPDHTSALAQLCQRCTRVGSSHSHAMVTARSRPEIRGGAWRPSSSGTLLRVPVPGTLDTIRASSSSVMPGRILPCDWTLYRWSEGPEPERMITVSLIGRSWPMERTLELTRQLRQALLDVAQEADLPLIPILHGRAKDGSPLQRPHLVFCPLPHVGFQYASGGILGLSFVLPVDATEEDRACVRRVIAGWFEAGAGLNLPSGVKLQFGPADGRQTLTDHRWCRPSKVWQTVSPMELPRHVVKRKGWNSDTWRRVDAAIRLACDHAGLPDPVEIDASWTPFAAGAPHVRAMHGETRRPLMHARVLFPATLEGPLIIGSSRHFGLGLMEPVEAFA
jgi:CRISPR-associated protein Csb2